MSIMYCIDDAFTLNTTVYLKTDNENDNPTPLFVGPTVDACKFMANAWDANKYDKIILHGANAENMKQIIYSYALASYDNSNIKIEVI